MYIPNQHLKMVHEQMLREAMEQNTIRLRRSPKPSREKRQRRLLHAPALLMVKLERSLEGFGQAYLEDRQQCSACTHMVNSSDAKLKSASRDLVTQKGC